MSTNASGGKLTDMHYYPYGETRSGTLATDRRYTGQRQESGLGLYDYTARYYDPALGRFLQADTIIPSPANPQSLNRYSYVLNSPLRYTDPTGHAHWVGDCGGYHWFNPYAKPQPTLQGSNALSSAATLGSSTLQSVSTRPSNNRPVCNPATDGVFIAVSHPARLAVRTEAVVGGEINGFVGNAGVEYRRVGIYPFGSPEYTYDELVAYAGIGPSIPIVGGVTYGAEWGPEGVGPSGAFEVMGAELSLQEGQIMLGYVQDIGARIGLEGETGHYEFFVTTRATFDHYGSARAFAEAYSPGGNGLGYITYQGYWDPPRGGCRTGFDVALVKAVNVWGLTVTVVGE